MTHSSHHKKSSDTVEPKAQVAITFGEQKILMSKNVSVLEALEASNIAIPNSCRAGLCQSCMMKSDCVVPANAQKGLSVSQITQGYFLACSCYPENDMTVELKGATNLTHATVADKKLLNESVLMLTLHVDFRWFPGQYLTLWKNELEGRSYSIASRCDDKKIIELHIKRHDQGIVSRWLHDTVKVNDQITLSTPLGDCFYTDDHADKPILMACTGTGLAPLYGILLETIAKQHSAPIYLYTGAGTPSQLYYQEKLRAIAAAHSHIHYLPVIRRESEEGMIEGDLVDTLQERHPDLKGWKVFLCGAPEMVKKVQRNCFFQGATVSDILVDAFEVAKPRVSQS